MAMVRPPSTYQVWRHPSSGSRPVSQGTRAPRTMKLAPPPPAARPATAPRLLDWNQTDSRPITGVVDPWTEKPMMAAMARAKMKLVEAPRKTMSSPLTIVETPTMYRVPYRGARVPKVRAATMPRIAAAVTRPPAWE